MPAIPSLEEEDAKRPSRERENLVGERTRIGNRIKSTLARQADPAHGRAAARAAAHAGKLPFLSLGMRGSTVPARVSRSIAVAVAMVDPVGAMVAVCGARQTLDLQLHQPLRTKSDHLAHVSALPQQGAKAHHLIGHRRVLRFGRGLATKPYRRSAITAAPRDTVKLAG